MVGAWTLSRPLGGARNGALQIQIKGQGISYVDGIILSDLALKFKAQREPHTKLVIHVKSSEMHGPNFGFGTQ